jgi:uncharacterized membrane protein
MRVEPSSLALAAFSIAYPLLALLAMRTVGPWPVIALLCAALALRGVFGRRALAPMTGALLIVALAMGLTALWNAGRAVRLYPVFMNAAMLAAFAATLVRPPSMIERFARIAEPDLSISGVRYTRRATLAWCVFFVLNGAVALWTALAASIETWALYNGLIAYLLMGAMFAGEWLVRRAVRARDAAHAPP